MESLKVTIVSDNQGKWSINKNYFSKEKIKNSIIQYETWKSSRLHDLKTHLVTISPELDPDQAKYAIKKIREKSDIIPIIAIRMENSINCKASLFGAGIDDYLCMPFDDRELTYRAEALIRRSRPMKSYMPITFRMKDFLLDYSNLLIKFDAGFATKLTQRQADLLSFFCKHPDLLLERSEILGHVWGKNDYFLGRSMDVIISSIRKILSAGTSIHLETIHGKGFILHTNN